MKAEPRTAVQLRALVHIGAVRLWNKVAFGFGAKRKKPGQRRTATGRKQSVSMGLLMVLFLPFLAFQAFLLSTLIVERIEEASSLAGAGAQIDQQRLLACVLCVLFAGLSVFGLATKNQDLGRVTWSFEWLFSFPVRPQALFLAKLVEYALLNPFGWIAFAALSSVVLFDGGYALAASLGLGLVLAFWLNLLLAAVQLTAETWLRLHLSLDRVKNVQAACTVVGILTLYGILALASPGQTPGWFVHAASRVPEASTWLPTALPALLAQPDGRELELVVCLALGLAIVAGSVFLCGRLVQSGLVRSAAPARGVRGRLQGSARTGSRLRGPRLRGLLGREVLLLLRDRSFLVQTVFVPLMIIGFQVFLNPQMLEAAGRDFQHAATLAYGVSAYVTLAVSATILSAEGKALWLLYTFPRRLEAMFVQKVALWIALGTAYALGILFCIGNPTWSRADLAYGALALGGLWIFAFVAAGLGILGTDPFEDRPQRRLRPGIMYLLMILGSSYAFAIYAPSWWLKAPVVVLSAATAYAVWEAVGERIPYLLDPTARPEPRVTLGHGLIASLAFFVLQALAAWKLAGDGPVTPAHVTLAYALSGGVVAVTTLLVFARAGIRDVFGEIRPHGSGTRPADARVLGIGAGLGVACAGLAAGYLWLVKDRDWFREQLENAQISGLGGGSNPVLVFALAVVAAPLVEEFIFRALVFRGLRHRLRWPAAALTSAALFALVHPYLGWAPVFGLGLATAAAFELSGTLLAPILCHAIYNAIVLTLQAHWL